MLFVCLFVNKRYNNTFPGPAHALRSAAQLLLPVYLSICLGPTQLPKFY